MEWLSLGQMLTMLPARIHRQRLYVAVDFPEKAVEHQHPGLPEVTISPNEHSLGFGGASLEGRADQAAGANPPAALACGSRLP